MLKKSSHRSAIKSNVAHISRWSAIKSNFKHTSRWFAISLIRMYQSTRSALHVILMAAFGIRFECKHTPTCSNYAIDCIRKYGTMRGLFLGVRRLATCF